MYQEGFDPTKNQCTDCGEPPVRFHEKCFCCQIGDMANTYMALDMASRLKMEGAHEH